MLYPNGTTSRPRVSSPYGPRDSSIGISSFHAGADLIGFGTIHAIAAGRVTFAGWMNNAAGRTVIIDHGNGITSVYMHNDTHRVRRGDRVTEGQPIATMGDTGNASGPCNHLEIRIRGKRTEPLAYIAARLPRTPAPTSAPTTTPTKEEEEMPIIIVQRKNSQLAKGMMTHNRRMREITRWENIAYRAAQEQAPDAVIYVTVTDDEYKNLLAGKD
jgi:hypothetical protein